MSLRELANIEPSKADYIVQILSNFNVVNAQNCDFSHVTQPDREALKQVIETEASNDSWNTQLALSILNAMRLLSRDKRELDYLYTPIVGRYVLESAKVLPSTSSPEDSAVSLEALKCLVNGLQTSTVMPEMFSPECHENLRRLLDYCLVNSEKPPHFSFYLRVFLATAKDETSVGIWKSGEYLDTVLTLLENATVEIEKSTSHSTELIERNEFILNMVIRCVLIGKELDSKTQENILIHTCRIFRHQNKIEDNNLIDGCVQLVAVLPQNVDILCPTSNEKRDTTIIQIIIDEMDRRLDTSSELLCAYTCALSRYCVINQEIRRFVRSIVLPPLHSEDVKRRPDEGNTLRNKLVRVIAKSNQDSPVVSQLMFILCKRSVPRMIKYTGFGHSAGFLANSGLLGQINEARNPDDSEDSETEDYREVEPQVNPVTGQVQPPNRESPFAGMSEEQQEFEAMRLVDMMNRIMETGVISPGTVGDDGRLRAVSHILELTKDVQFPEKENSGDSD